ncbi:MAG: efflux RND transporter permease subunit, partial [Pseudomonadota bacterium]
MNIIKAAIERPIAVISAVLLVVMFGWLSLQTIPIQLVPDVNRPVIQVTTSWPGAAPEEIEREIVNRQEEVLKGLDSLEEMVSSSTSGQGRITLTFAIDANMDRSLLLTANRLDRVSNYPDEANEPRLSTADANDNAIAWFGITRAPGNEAPIHTFGEFVEDVVLERLERVPGVAQANMFGGADREMQVVVEPDRLARFGLTVNDVISALRQANVATTAGNVDEGKR